MISNGPRQGVPQGANQNGGSASRVVGVGEMADRVRGFDWSTTPLGPIESWPQELVMAVNLTLSSPVPARTLWGRDHILIYNDSYRRFPGKRHPEALGKPAREVYRESWHVVGPILEKAFTTGQSCSHERLCVPIETEEGLKDHFLDYAYTPMFTEGEVGGLFGTLHDVTGEVTMMRSLRESEARSDRVLQSIGDAVIVTDAESRVVKMNPVAESLTGWRASEAAGRRLSEVFRIVDETTREAAENPAEKIRRRPLVVGRQQPVLLICRNGEEMAIDDNGAPILDDTGDLLGIVLVFRNIHDRRMAERERSELSRQLAMLLDATTDGVLSVENDWKIVYRNRQAQEVLQATGELTGRQFWDVFPQAAFEGSPFFEHYHRAMEKRTPAKFEAYYPAPLNAWYAVNVQPAERGIVIFFRDVTEAKRAESALLKSEKLAAVGRLASSIAHEINNPLESVMNLIYLARHSENPDTKKYLDLADDEIRRVSIIANQTLRFHKQASNPQAVSAADLFSTVMSIYEGRLRNARVDVEKKFRTGEPVMCFQGDVRQVLNNLVSNALEAMPLGGRLLIRSRAGHNWKTGERGLILTIADSGGGIPPGVLNHIFDAFFTTKGTAGNGLGLWVCQEIVERHHGSLRVRSCQREGRNGTAFTLFLPFSPRREAHAADSEDPRADGAATSADRPRSAGSHR